MAPNAFIIMIYMCFVMYGWTASLLGGVWPQIAKDINANISLLGILVMISYASSGIASMVTYKIRQKLGTSRSNILGLFCISVGMFTFAMSKNFIMVILAMTVLGFGSGIVDINCNCYVVKAYEPKFVSLMHACWGLGATIGPMVMSFAMTKTTTYRNGFYFTATILLIIMIVLFFMKRYWEAKKKTLDKSFVELHSVTDDEKNDKTSFVDLIKMKNTVFVMLCFFLTNGAGCGLSAWVATIAVEQRGLTMAEGAITASAYFFALMAGRLIMGLLSKRLRLSTILKFCIAGCFISTAVYYLPFRGALLVYIHAVFMGFFAGPLIPFLNAILKEIFDNKILGALISYGGAIGLIGVAVTSATLTATVNVITINHIQIIPTIYYALLYAFFVRIMANSKKQEV